MPSIFRKAAQPSASLSPTPTTPPAAPANDREIAVSTIFGIFAVIFALITLWQGHRLWLTLRYHTNGAGQGHGQENDLELPNVPTTASTMEPTNSHASTIGVAGEGANQPTLDTGGEE